MKNNKKIKTLRKQFQLGLQNKLQNILKITLQSV